MKRIVYTLAAGKRKHAECALGLGRSLKLIGDNTRRVVVTDQPDNPWLKSFDEVLRPIDPIEWVYISKLNALDRTDADQVLFIDADCLVFKRLDHIFDYCQGRGLCVQGMEVTEGFFYGDVASNLTTCNVGSLANINGGMLYYERSQECRQVIELCRELATTSKELPFTWGSVGIPEEPYLSLAMARIGIDRPSFNHVIPHRLDFMNSAIGLVGPLELNVLRNRCQFVCRNFDTRFIQPTIFHAWRYINFSIYWKQLDRLRKLEEYESTHSSGYMSPGHRLRRSVERRWLKYIKRVH